MFHCLLIIFNRLFNSESICLLPNSLGVGEGGEIQNEEVQVGWTARGSSLCHSPYFCITFMLSVIKMFYISTTES